MNALATWAMLAAILIPAAYFVWACIVAEPDPTDAELEAAIRRHPANGTDTALAEVVGVLKPSRYTRDELEILRELPMEQWQAAVDAHRLLDTIHTDADLLALWGER